MRSVRPLNLAVPGPAVPLVEPPTGADGSCAGPYFWVTAVDPIEEQRIFRVDHSLSSVPTLLVLCISHVPINTSRAAITTKLVTCPPVKGKIPPCLS